MELMEEWLLIGYLGLLALAMVALLCGDWPIFDRTPVRALHSWITGGACDSLQELLRLCFGASGVRGYQYVEQFCCERSNPILQIFYLALVVGTFLTYSITSFKFIPGLYVSSIHRTTGPLCVVIGVCVFLVASFSDPGKITPSNVALYGNIYPFDGIIFTEKTCSTCNLPRPARSKHCSICDRCVARFDHHCGWMNTCIGAKNLRYFLLFLVWHWFLCCYGAIVLIAILAGEVKKHRVMERISFYYRVTTFYDKIPHLLQWLLAFHNYQLLLLFYLIAVSILIGAFLAYHCYLIARNTTTNEAYKWDVYKRWYAEAVQGQTQEPQTAEVKGSKLFWKSLWTCGFWNSSKQTNPEPVRRNLYHRGVLSNFCEVLFPLQQRAVSFQVDMDKQE